MTVSKHKSEIHSLFIQIFNIHNIYRSRPVAALEPFLEELIILFFYK